MTVILAIIGLIILLASLFYFTTDRLSQFGADPSGSRLERIKQSNQYKGREFVNRYPVKMSFTFNDFNKMMRRWLFGKAVRNPEIPLDIVRPDPSLYAFSPENDVRTTWLGHSSVLIEIDGFRILTDPVYKERCSPSSVIGPKRFHPVPIPIEDLPPLDAVIISHDHYDHLDRDAVIELAKTGVKFYTSLGVGSHLEKWGIDSSQIIEFDWWDSVSMSNDSLQIIATPARHFSGRGILSSRNSTLWSTWVIIGPNHRVFFCGDTGDFPDFTEIGEKYGPFDLTMMKIGAYADQWPDVHLNPEQSVKAHLALKGQKMMPIHWGTFNLAFHAWFEPPERLVKAAESDNIDLIIPRPGQSFTLTDPPPVEPWWNDYRKHK